MERWTRSGLIVSLIGLVICIGTLIPGAGHAQTAQTTVNLLTMPPGLTNYTVSVAQGQLISKKTNVKVVVQPTQGQLVIPPMMENKDAETGTLAATATYWAYVGTGDYKKPHRSLRVLQAGESIYFGTITRGDTNIKTIPDLKGKRVTYQVTSSLSRTIMEKQFEAYGLDAKKDVKLQKAEDNAFAFRDLESGRTDAVGGVTLGGSKMTEAATKFKIVLLPFPADKATALQKQVPGVFSAVSSSGYGVDVGVPCVGVPTLFIARADLNNDVAYTLVKALLENYKELAQVNASLAGWKPEVAVRELEVPYHPGAIKYYKEKGMWSARMDQLQQELAGK